MFYAFPRMSNLKRRSRTSRRSSRAASSARFARRRSTSSPLWAPSGAARVVATAAVAVVENGARTRSSVGRLGRRSPADIGRMVENIVSLLQRSPDGLRAEQIRERSRLSGEGASASARRWPRGGPHQEDGPEARDDLLRGRGRGAAVAAKRRSRGKERAESSGALSSIARHRREAFGGALQRARRRVFGHVPTTFRSSPCRGVSPLASCAWARKSRAFTSPSRCRSLARSRRRARVGDGSSHLDLSA